MIAILQIEEDGHFNGGPPAMSWCAEVTGIDARYGFARSFVGALRDYKNSSASMAGRVYGIISNYPLHEGRVYEVSRYRGKPSKRHLAREFVTVKAAEIVSLTSEEAMAMAIELDAARSPVELPAAQPPPKIRRRTTRAKGA